MKNIIYKTNKLVINNKVRYGEFKISVKYENYITDEIKRFLQLVNQDEMDFNCSHFNDILNKKIHTITRVNGEIVAYHQLVDSNYCVLKEIFQVSNDTKDNSNNGLLMNFVCVNPKYYGNLFFFSNYILAYKYGIENKYNYISQLIDIQSPLQMSVLNVGFRKYSLNSFKIQNGWDSYFSNIETLLFVSKSFDQSNQLQLLNLINKLTSLTLSNDRVNFFNLLQHLNNKSKL